MQLIFTHNLNLGALGDLDLELIVDVTEDPESGKIIEFEIEDINYFDEDEDIVSMYKFTDLLNEGLKHDEGFYKVLRQEADKEAEALAFL